MIAFITGEKHQKLLFKILFFYGIIISISLKGLMQVTSVIIFSSSLILKSI